MRTGFDMLQSNDDFNEHQVDFLRKTVCIMKILTKEAMRTAERFVKACDRTQITGNDIYYALMYEAHEFFGKDWDNEFVEELEHERQHTYYTDDESEDEEEEVVSENNETYCIELKNENDAEFHSKVLKYSNEWRDWFPDDPVKMMIKNCIDKTRRDIESRTDDT